MTTTFSDGNVRAPCPDCEGTITTFEMRSGGSEFGSVIRAHQVLFEDATWGRIVYMLLRCASCGRGGLATIYDNGTVADGRLIDFYPLARDTARLPADVPGQIEAEYREAELCASVSAWRGASALLRSALEKTLAANGYDQGPLAGRINDAASDGVITAARQRRAHDDVRSLGNDILHDEWRPITEAEYAAAHHYVLRILEDFYDHRGEVEALLRDKGRLAASTDVEE